MPGSFAIFLTLVSRDVSKLDKKLLEGSLLLRRLLRVEGGRWRAMWVTSEALFDSYLRAHFEPVSVLILRLTQGTLKRVRASHTIADVVHVTR